MKANQYQERNWQGTAGRPNALVQFKSVYFEGNLYHPSFGDRTTLLILNRKMPKSVSFIRAYSGWRAGGAKDLQELGEGRAFFRWLQRHELGIQWKKDDFTIHPLFTGENIPRHDPNDDFARGLSFALRPVRVQERAVKLYIEDQDVLSLLRLQTGEERDFLSLVEDYVEMRFGREMEMGPAPGFLEWVKSMGKRPLFHQGQMGFSPAVEFIR